MEQEYLDEETMRISAINYDTALIEQFLALGGECLRDGDMYGAVIGGLPEGCAGFEKTRSSAISKCMHNFYNEEAKIPGKNSK